MADRHRRGHSVQRDGAAEVSPSNVQASARQSLEMSRGGESRTSLDVSSNASHQRFILTDPIAFRYLEEDPSTAVLERRRELVGYQVYIVEQWATSRSHPTFVITTYTGDPSDKATVGVISVPTNEAAWSQRLRVYFKALNQYHARRRDTPYGVMMVTNLSGFPSSLTIIAVPDGDLGKHRADYFVNEDLKRLGCSGRVGLTLAEPNAATIAKFHQLYRTSGKNNIYSSVTEMVKLCQLALHLFDTLEIEYGDGLLCDITEKAINNWWVGIGADVYNMEPRDGILGASTVAALLGLLMGSRNRLHAIGSTVPKDPYDVDGMKRGIASFQRSQRLPRTRRLDHKTLHRLHKASEKAAYSEGWSVPRAVKSTVAELSGKGGEMLADVVGRRDKAGIAEIETSDIDHFVHLAFGERCKWLWHGKPYKRASDSTETEAHLDFKPDEQGGFKWSHRRTNTVLTSGRSGDDAGSIMGRTSMEEADREQQEGPSRNGVIRVATGLISEGKSGFDRIKNVVNVRGHQSKLSKDDSPKQSPRSPILEDREGQSPQQRRPGMRRASTTPANSPTKYQAENERFGPIIERGPSKEETAMSSARAEPIFTDEIIHSPHSEKMMIPELHGPEDGDGDESRDETVKSAQPPKSTASSTGGARTPVAGSIYHGVELNEVLPAPEGPIEEISPLLMRTQSFSAFESRNVQSRPPDAFPRHLSFSVIDGMAIKSDFGISPDEPSESATLDQQMMQERMASEIIKQLRGAIASVSRNEAAWTSAQIKDLAGLLAGADNTQRLLEDSLYQPTEASQEMKAAASRLLEEEKEILGEGRKELETLAAKLEYEIGSLQGKVEDVELGVNDFERAVGGVEARVDELEAEVRGSGAWNCIVS